MILNDNKLLINNEGKILIRSIIPSINIEVKGSYFPTALKENLFLFRIYSRKQNTMYIDYGDGNKTEIESQGNQWTYQRPFYTYNDGIEIHNVKISFKNPSDIYIIYLQGLDFYGEFPQALSLYNLDNLVLRYLNFENYPKNYGVSYLNYLYIQNISKNTLNEIPSWIIKSVITNLRLGSGINYTNQMIDDLKNISNLKYLTIDSSLVTDIPNSYVEILTLQYLGLAEGFKTISSTISKMTNLVGLSFGLSISNQSSWGGSFGYGGLIDYGAGLKNFKKLEYFGVSCCRNLTTDLPIGMEDWENIKVLDFTQCFWNSAKSDIFFKNLLKFIESNASKITGNTKFRNLTFYSSFQSADSIKQYNYRPEGLYQKPEGYVQGSFNGNPNSSMEILWILVNQYRWTMTICNSTLTGSEILTP